MFGFSSTAHLSYACDLLPAYPPPLVADGKLPVPENRPCLKVKHFRAMIDRLQDLQRLAAGSVGTTASQHGQASPVHRAEETRLLQHPHSLTTSDGRLAETPRTLLAGRAAAAAAFRYSRAISSAPKASCQGSPSISSASTEAPPSSRTSAHSGSFPPLCSFFPSLAETEYRDEKPPLTRHEAPSISVSSASSSPSRTCTDSTDSESEPRNATDTVRDHPGQKQPCLGDAAVVPSGDPHGESPPLFAYLRRAKSLKIVINEVLLLQQRAGYLLLLHPPGTGVCLPSFSCVGCSPQPPTGENAQTDISRCHNCELATHLHSAQRLLHRAHEGFRQLHENQEEEERRYMREQAIHSQHTGFFIKHVQVQHAFAATAAELRIRRSVLKQQQQQLQVALEQQAQLEQDLRARWEGEVSAEMRARTSGRAPASRDWICPRSTNLCLSRGRPLVLS